METSDPKVNEDIEVLKEDVHKLRDRVVGILHSARSRSRGMAMDTGGRIRGMMSDLRGKAKDTTDQLRDKSEVVKDRGYEAVENWRGTIEDRPITSLVIAFAAGLVLALFMARRRY
jgi:ElaB/YqjD/DUF883 family membrane-anchored ribosome-binding protein